MSLGTAVPTVAQQMSREVLAVFPESTLAAAAQVMMERSVGSAAVVAGGELVGIITERDVLRSVALGLVPWTTHVSECMTVRPVTVAPETPRAEAMAMMMSRGFRHLPVKDGKRLVGLVSLRDLLRGPAEARQPTLFSGSD